MNWYLAKLVYRIVCGTGNHPAQFEEQLRLIYAEDYLHAFNKARLMGEMDIIDWQNFPDIAIRWQFIDVTELLPLAVQTDGAEIYAAQHEEKDAALYIRTTHKKANQLLQQSLQHFTHINSATIGNRSI